MSIAQRELKFRAYILDEGERVNGLGIDSAHHYIEDGAVFVQQTGMKDKNGTEICEGDILKSERMSYNVHGSYTGMEVIHGVVEFFNYQFILRYPSGGFDNIRFGSQYHEVLGNIYETPELLEGVSNE